MRLKDNALIKLVEKLNDSEMLWLFLSALVSADNLNNEHDCEGNLLVINRIRENIDYINIDEETKQKLLKYVNEADEIINNDLAKFKAN